MDACAAETKTPTLDANRSLPAIGRRGSLRETPVSEVASFPFGIWLAVFAPRNSKFFRNSEGFSERRSLSLSPFAVGALEMSFGKAAQVVPFPALEPLIRLQGSRKRSSFPCGERDSMIGEVGLPPLSIFPGLPRLWKPCFRN